MRFMAQIAGKLQSMKLAMGPIVMVHLRRLYLLINTANSWRATRWLTEGVLADLQGVWDNVQSWNGQSLLDMPFQYRLIPICGTHRC